jgi:hypothetical protein
VPLIDDGQVRNAKKKEFIREITIFADYRIDDDRVLDQCFQHDRKYWKLDRLLKDSNDIKATEKVIRENFKLLKDCFVSINAVSKYPTITMDDFGKFMQNIKSLDENLSRGAVDNNFI